MHRLLGVLVAPVAAFQLGLGINLGNTLEATCEGCWAPAAQEYYFDAYKAAGFQTVRIPVNWGYHMLEQEPYTVNATWIQRVQTVVDWCTSRDFNCIINSHWDSWLNNETQFEAMLPRFFALWQQVGSAFAAAPSTVMFESFNEPYNLTTTQLNQLLQTFYNATRATNPDRWLIFGWLQYMGVGWPLAATSPCPTGGGDDMCSNYDAMWLPDWRADGRIAVEVHNYDPWMVCGKGVQPWGQPGDVANMQAMFANMSQWSANHGIPVFFGEWGCTKENDTGTRYQWYADFARHCMGSSNATQPGAAGGCLVWDDDGSFGIYNRTGRTWNNGILTAIGLQAQ